MTMTHNHETSAAGEPHPSSISRGWQRLAVWGDAVIGLVQVTTQALSVVIDGMHNLGDALAYRLQTENILNPNLTPERRAQRRKLSYWILSSGSVAVGVHAGIDRWTGHTPEVHNSALYAATSSMVLSGLMLAGLYRDVMKKPREDRSEHEYDLVKHFWMADVPSAGLALTGAILQRHSIPAEQWTAMASAAVGAWVFRPTKANLSHHCMGGSESSHAHESGVSRSWLTRLQSMRETNVKKPEGRRRWRWTVAGAGMAALALTGSLLTDDGPDRQAAKAPQTAATQAPESAPTSPTWTDRLLPPKEFTGCVLRPSYTAVHLNRANA